MHDSMKGTRSRRPVPVRILHVFGGLRCLPGCGVSQRFVAIVRSAAGLASAALHPELAAVWYLGTANGRPVNGSGLVEGPHSEVVLLHSFHRDVDARGRNLQNVSTD